MYQIADCLLNLDICEIALNKLPPLASMSQVVRAVQVASGNVHIQGLGLSQDLLHFGHSQGQYPPFECIKIYSTMPPRWLEFCKQYTEFDRNKQAL